MVEKDVKIDKTKKWYFYVCSFLIYCFVGWIYEVIWELTIGNGFVNRGFLHGFYLPIYGFGALALIFSLSNLMEKKIKIKKLNLTYLVVFISILIIVSVIEFSASYIMELIFNKRWWDYSYDVLNLNGRISLRNSTLLALGGMFYLYILQPMLKFLLPKLSEKTLKIMAILIISCMSIDFISVIIGYLI